MSKATPEQLRSVSYLPEHLLEAAQQAIAQADGNTVPVTTDAVPG